MNNLNTAQCALQNQTEKKRIFQISSIPGSTGSAGADTLPRPRKSSEQEGKGHATSSSTSGLAKLPKARLTGRTLSRERNKKASKGSTAGERNSYHATFFCTFRFRTVFKPERCCDCMTGFKTEKERAFIL